MKLIKATLIFPFVAMGAAMLFIVVLLFWFIGVKLPKWIDGLLPGDL